MLIVRNRAFMDNIFFAKVAKCFIRYWFKHSLDQWMNDSSLIRSICYAITATYEEFEQFSPDSNKLNIH